MSALNPQAQAAIDKLIAKLPTAAQAVATTYTAPFIQLIVNAVGDGIDVVAAKLANLKQGDYESLYAAMTQEERNEDMKRLAEMSREAAQKNYDSRQLLANFFDDVGKLILSAGVSAVLL
jgi:hypothetical protein